MAFVGPCTKVFRVIDVYFLNLRSTLRVCLFCTRCSQPVFLKLKKTQFKKSSIIVTEIKTNQWKVNNDFRLDMTSKLKQIF